MSTENSAQETAQTTAQDTSATATQTPAVEASAPTQPGGIADTVKQNLEAKVNKATEAATKPATEAPPAQQTYTPNFKFKAYDKEHEIEEALRPFITDAEKEKVLRKLHEKAYALDPMKENLTKVRTEFESYKQSIEPKVRSYDFLNTLVQNNDLETFFKKVGVPDQALFDLAQKKLELLQAGPAQQAEYQRQMDIREQAYFLQNQNQEFQNMYQQQAVQTRAMQLDTVLSRPDVLKYATSWDERAGQIGAFKDLVIQEAQAAFYQQQRDLSAEEAVNLVVTKFGKILPLQQASEQTIPAGQPTAPKPVPIIPNIAGKGTSPIKKAPQSLDDLRKLAKEAEAAG